MELNTSKILEGLTFPVVLEVLQHIGSTNDYLKQIYAKQSVETIHACIAEQQTGGRGQFHRPWYSPALENIYLSLAVPCVSASLEGVSLAVAVAVCTAINTIAEVTPQIFIKWPNDLMCCGAKLGGILVEIQQRSKVACNLIIGIGLNVNMQKVPENLFAKPWISLLKASGALYDRSVLCGVLISEVVSTVHFFQEKGFQGFLEKWRDLDYLYGKQCALEIGGERFEGKALGVNAQGHLVLQLASGLEKICLSGETQLIAF